MSLLPTSTYAGPSQGEAIWAVAGSVGPGGGVTQLVAGSGIELDPSTGEGVVTISATGGGVTQLVAGTNITLDPSTGEGVVTINAAGGGGVTSVTASGAGITATPTTGAVTLTNTGVTSLVAGTGISLSGATGAVTVSNTVTSPAFTGLATYNCVVGGTTTLTVTGLCGTLILAPAGTPSNQIFGPRSAGGTGWNLLNNIYLQGPFNANSIVLFSDLSPYFVGGLGPVGLGANYINWNATARWDSGANGMLMNIYGAGSAPDWNSSTPGLTYTIQFLVIQRS